MSRTRQILAVLSGITSVAASAWPQQAGVGLDIAVYGATGRVGRHIVEEALNRGHSVTAVSRDPSRIETQHQNLSVVRGDVLDEASILDVATGQEVLIVSVRGIVGNGELPSDALQYVAAVKLTNALANMGERAPRVIHIGGAGSLENEDGELLAEQMPRLFLPKWMELEIDGQVLALEAYRQSTAVRWTYATPAQKFTNGERTGRYRVGGDRLMLDERGRSRISRADFAVAVIDEAESATHVRRRFSVAD